MRWNVTIRETLVRVVAVEAEDAYTAKDAVRSRYRAGKIVLEADDFSDVEMEAEKAGESSPRPFLYVENHSLGEWFQRRLVPMMKTEKLLLL